MVDEKVLLFILTVGIVALASIFLRRYKNATKLHLHIYSCLWIILLGGILFQNDDYLISFETYLFFCIAWIMIYAGTFFSYIIFAPSSSNKIKPLLVNPDRWKKILYVLVILSFVSNYFYYKELFAKLSSIDNVVALRTEYGHDAIEESSNMFFNIFGRIFNIYIPIAVYLYKEKKIYVIELLGIVILSLIIASASLTRAPILNVFIILFVSMYVLKVRIKPVFITISIIAFFGLIYFITQQIAMLSSVDEGGGSFYETATLYVFGSLKAFDNLLKGQYAISDRYDSSYYSLDFLNYFLKKIGLINSYPALVREYTNVLDTNVYTYLDAFTLDFGRIGIIFGPFIIGFISGFVSFKVKVSSHAAYIVMYCYCCYGLAFSFMNNEFIRSTFFVVGLLCIIFNLFASVEFKSPKFVSA